LGSPTRLPPSRTNYAILSAHMDEARRAAHSDPPPLPIPRVRWRPPRHSRHLWTSTVGGHGALIASMCHDPRRRCVSAGGADANKAGITRPEPPVTARSMAWDPPRKPASSRSGADRADGFSCCSAVKEGIRQFRRVALDERRMARQFSSANIR